MGDRETESWRREIETVIEWLADGAPTIDQPQHLLAELCERLAGGGLPLARVAVYVRTLHPCVMGRSFQWRPGKEVQVSDASYGIMETADFLESPNRRVMRTGVPIRRRIRDPDGPDDFPILAEFRAEGMTDYFMQPIRFTNGEIHAVSWVTKEPGGFSDAHLEALDRINPAFARVTEIYALRRTARNILDTYLGPTSGERVLRGLIKRGDGDDIRAVIWFCDLRGSTPLADSLSRETFLSALNQFFEATAGAVLDHGGEVLRFMGDAALAIFPIDASEDGMGSEAAACKAALEAARDAITRMAMLNRTRSASGEPTLGFGIGPAPRGRDVREHRGGPTPGVHGDRLRRQRGGAHRVAVQGPGSVARDLRRGGVPRVGADHLTRPSRAARRRCRGRGLHPRRAGGLDDAIPVVAALQRNRCSSCSGFRTLPMPDSRPALQQAS